LENDINSHEKITIHTNSQLKDIDGHVGNFNVMIARGDEQQTINVGVIILATGGLEYRPTEYLYGTDPRVITQLELEEKIASGEVDPNVQEIVMIQCVGSRTEERPYCSRICCSEAIKNGLKLKKVNPNTRINILYKDIRTYGFKEDYYSQALDEGILFTRYDDDKLPDVRVSEDNKLKVQHFSIKCGNITGTK
jgi:heterodisulfide reductase subunit A